MAIYAIGSGLVDDKRPHPLHRARPARSGLRIAIALLLAMAALGACVYWDLGVVVGFALLPRLAGAPTESAPPLGEWVLYLSAPWALLGFLAWYCIKQLVHPLPRAAQAS
jgi:hypothetical protein